MHNLLTTSVHNLMTLTVHEVLTLYTRYSPHRYHFSLLNSRAARGWRACRGRSDGSSKFYLEKDNAKTSHVLSRDFLDKESSDFLDGMSSGFLDGYGGGIAGWLFQYTSAEKSQISIPLVTAKRSHSFAKNWASRGRCTTTSKTG